MRFRIVVCNQEPLGDIDGDALIAAITRSNFQTLCDQYGLNSEMIEPGRLKLEVLVGKGSTAPFFALYYHPNRQIPVIVDERSICDPGWEEWLGRIRREEHSLDLEKHLQFARYVVVVLLEPGQIEDLGRLLAYELARWAAERGKGVVRGLDGNWYRLNDHQAFIPI